MKGLCWGFFGKIFTSYDRIEKKARRGVLLGALAGTPEGREKSIRRRFMKHFDESLGMRLIKRCMVFLRSSRLNFYGAYFATFGLYSIITLLISSSVKNGGAPSADVFVGVNFWSAVIILLASIPLLISSSSLLSLVAESISLRTLLEDAAGVPEYKFEAAKKVKNKNSYFIAIIAGMLTGGLTYFVSPLRIISVLAFACLICLFMSFPELGVVSTIFVAPFLGFFERSSTVLAIMVSVTALSYLIKILVGRRTITFKLVDLFVLLFAVLLFLGGAITSGGRESLASAIMYTVLILMYFLVVNLMNTREWLERCVSAIAIPSALIAVIGILGYASSSMPSKWLDTQMFSGITDRAVSSFDNPNMLVTYLILTAPFIWVFFKRKGISASGKIIAAIGGMASLVCTVLTWSRGGWLGMIAAAVIFALINYKYVFKYFIIVGISSPLWIRILPNNIITRFSSIGNLADSSTYYRLFTWKGSLKMLGEYFLGGIGVGESAFSQIYPLYSYVGTEITMHSHNLYLELAIELGVMGLLVFAIITFMILQRGLGCIKHNLSDAKTVISVSAALSGLVAALVHGMFDHVWYNYRVFFVFWVVAALMCAFANVYPKRNDDPALNYGTEDEGSLDIIFGERNDAFN